MERRSAPGPDPSPEGACGTTDRAAVAAVVVWIALLAVPNVLALSVWPWTQATPRDAGSIDGLIASGTPASFAWGLLFTLIVLALVRRAAVFVWLTLPLMILMPVEAWYVLNYGTPTNPHLIGVLVETNPTEFAEFVSGRLQATLIAAAVMGLAATAAAAWIASRRWTWRHRSRTWLLALSIGTVAASASAALLEEATLPGDVRQMNSPQFGFLPAQVEGFESVFPWGVPLRVVDYYGQRRSIERGMRLLASERIGATMDAARAPRNVVLVIGETGRGDRFGLNGYARETTPRLKKVDGLDSFSDAISSTAASRTSIPFILTRVHPGTNVFHALTTEKSVVSAFSEAGYRTWWISNQMTVSQWDNGISIYAEEAHVRRYLNMAGFGSRSDHDEVLLPELERALQDPAGNRFIVLHTLGSHFNYRNRYPDPFDRFQPSLAVGERTTIFDMDKRVELGNAYDNSILYTDHFLAEVIRRLEAAGGDSVMLYTADHGESLFEGTCFKAGHGVTSATNFHVPFMIWMSAGARARDPSAWGSILANRDRPVTAESVFPTLVALGGLRLPRDKHELSLTADTLPGTARLVSTDSLSWLDYDRDLPAVDCARRGLVGRVARPG